MYPIYFFGSARIVLSITCFLDSADIDELIRPPLLIVVDNMLNNNPEAIMIGIIENFVPYFAMNAHEKISLITFFEGETCEGK